MDRDTLVRTLAAVALSMAILFVWAQLFPPPEPPPPAPDEIAEEGAGSAAASRGEADVDRTLPGYPSVADDDTPYESVSGAEGAEPTTVSTSVMELDLSPRGGRILSWRLLEHDRVPGEPERGIVDLVSPESRALDRLPLSVALPDSAAADAANGGWHQQSERSATADEADDLRIAIGTRAIEFLWADGRGFEIRKTIFFPEERPYEIVVDWEATRAGVPMEGARLTWGPQIGRPIDDETSTRFAYRGRAAIGERGDVEREKPGKLRGALVWAAGDEPDWIGLESQFFAATFIPESPGSASVEPVLLPRGAEGESSDEEEEGLLVASGAQEFALFGGPKESRILVELDRPGRTSLRDMIEWGMLGILARPLYEILAYIHGLVGNWGVAIILLTLLIRLAFYPFMQKAMVNMRRSQQKMQKLQPKMKKIKEKYEGKRDMESRRRMQEDMMALYKTEGFNPASMMLGCLPLLIQMPFLIAIYNVLTVAVELRGAPLAGWIVDLSAADPFFVTPIVMGVTMFAQQLLTMTKVEDPQQKAQQRMMLIMPVMFTYFFIWLPAGVVLYWLTSNVLGILQQLLINKQAAKLMAAESSSAKGAKK